MFKFPFLYFLRVSSVILLILCIIPLWDSIPSHSLSGKELNPFSKEDVRLSGCCALAYKFHFILRRPSLGLSNSSLTLRQKSSTLPLRKMPVFQGVATWHTNFTFSCFIPLWDLAAAHSPSSKELNPSSQEDARLSRCCALIYKFHLSCIILLWDSATAHAPSGKELILSSLEESSFSGFIFLQCSHIILPRFSLV